MMQLIDSHCHLNFTEFDHDRAQVIEQCSKLGITDMVIPGTTADSWPKLIDLCQQFPQLHPALGLHPMFMDKHNDNDLNELETCLNSYRPVAIGEIGLDFYLPDQDRQRQIALFHAQVKIARKHALPVILHVRKAHDEVLKILRSAQLKGGVVHAFNGSEQQAMQYRDLGFLFGVGGALTYKRAQKLQRLFSQLPDDSIVLETDSPDMPLADQQGQRNTPENIPVILQKLAELRQQPVEQLAAISTDNCKRLFNLA